MLLKRFKIIIDFLSDYENVNFSSLEISKALNLNRRTVDRILKILIRKKLIDFDVEKIGLKKIPTKKYKHKK